MKVFPLMKYISKMSEMCFIKKKKKTTPEHALTFKRKKAQTWGELNSEMSFLQAISINYLM